MARQKQVYDTDQIAHLWMHKAQDSASNPQHNFYFENETIYSYGSHFPIARHVEHKGKPAILYTTRTYSPTTGKHLSLVWRAIPPTVPVFLVPNPDRGIKEQLDYHKTQFSAAHKTLLDAKDKRARVKAFIALNGVRDDYNHFAKLFGYAVKASFKLPKSYPITVTQLEAEVAEYQASSQRRRESARKAADTRRANRRAEWARRSEEYAAERERQKQEHELRASIIAEYKSDIMEAWRQGKKEWCSGDVVFRFDYGSMLGLPTMLRVDGNEVQTSLGARFPVSHARLGFKLVQKCRGDKKEYVHNGHTIHLGHYAIDKIDADGNVTAGCHYVTWDEISRLAPILEGVEVSQ